MGKYNAIIIFMGIIGFILGAWASRHYPVDVMATNGIFLGILFALIGLLVVYSIDQDATYKETKTINLLETEIKSIFQTKDGGKYIVADETPYKVDIVEINDSSSLTLLVDIYESRLSKTEKLKTTLVIGTESDKSKLNLILMSGLISEFQSPAPY